MQAEADRKARQRAIEDTVLKERGRLFRFIRDRVPAREDAEDVLQDVFYQLVAGYGDIQSIEKLTSWLFTVARNRITDLYRKKKPEPASNRLMRTGDDDGGELISLEEILPDLSGHPDRVLASNMIWEELEAALAELPKDQRDVFVAHEFEDKSFKDMAEESGESINTLLSRKRYSILFLRKRLENLYNDL